MADSSETSSTDMIEEAKRFLEEIEPQGGESVPAQSSDELLEEADVEAPEVEVEATEEPELVPVAGEPSEEPSPDPFRRRTLRSHRTEAPESPSEDLFDIDVVMRRPAPAPPEPPTRRRRGESTDLKPGAAARFGGFVLLGFGLLALVSMAAAIIQDPDAFREIFAGSVVVTFVPLLLGIRLLRRGRSRG